MSLSYTFDPSLSRAWLDNARLIIGDTDVTPSSGGVTPSPTLTLKDQVSLNGINVTLDDSITYPFCLLPDDTYLAAFANYGWSGGLSFIINSLITRFGQEPDKFSEANGVGYQFGQRIRQWKSLLLKVGSGDIPDPLLTFGSVSPSSASGPTDAVPCY